MLPSPTTLPASWYCSKELQELERRAVFQRSWYFLGTVTKFKDEHDEHFEIAQVSLTVNTTTVSENKKQIRVVDDETVCIHSQGQELGRWLKTTLNRMESCKVIRQAPG
jgi:hypothetical protein